MSREWSRRSVELLRTLEAEDDDEDIPYVTTIRPPSRTCLRKRPPPGLHSSHEGMKANMMESTHGLVPPFSPTASELLRTLSSPTHGRMRMPGLPNESLRSQAAWNTGHRRRPHTSLTNRLWCSDHLPPVLESTEKIMPPRTWNRSYTEASRVQLPKSFGLDPVNVKQETRVDSLTEEEQTPSSKGSRKSVLRRQTMPARPRPTTSPPVYRPQTRYKWDEYIVQERPELNRQDHRNSWGEPKNNRMSWDFSRAEPQKPRQDSLQPECDLDTSIETPVRVKIPPLATIPTSRSYLERSAPGIRLTRQGSASSQSTTARASLRRRASSATSGLVTYTRALSRRAKEGMAGLFCGSGVDIVGVVRRKRSRRWALDREEDEGSCCEKDNGERTAGGEEEGKWNLVNWQIRGDRAMAPSELKQEKLRKGMSFH